MGWLKLSIFPVTVCLKIRRRKSHSLPEGLALQNVLIRQKTFHIPGRISLHNFQFCRKLLL